ncbi:MAG: glutathione peroxidase [Bacteriovoracaceae bacterium]|nr:glutathione peroxidase [Bacteriovoracaceae bacterium]
MKHFKLGIASILILFLTSQFGLHAATKKEDKKQEKKQENAQTQVQAKAQDKNSPSLYDIKVKTIEGKETTLSEYKNKVLLIVNTASQCGYTSQYEQLQALYKTYGDKNFVILGFPSNDFNGQEPGKDEEIAKFCKTKFQVTFPMFSKNSVKGKDKQPLYDALLKLDTKNKNEEIGWNFEKFLIGKDGTLVGRYKSSVSPDHKDIKEAIEKAIK